MLFLAERLTFDQLFRYSEPKRVKRSFTVRGPPLDIDANSDAIYHTFNFKSHPSTTGLRHHGYIKFYRPRNRNPNNVPLQHVPCEVDCTCPDFRYRWAWVLKQHQSSRVGPGSMNQAWNQAPRVTNPAKIPGLCKHILAVRDYIYGMLSKFPSGEPDTAEKLDQLVRYADRRWQDFDAQSALAKEREAWFKAAKDARRRGEPLPPNMPPGPIPPSYRPATDPVPPQSTEPPALPAALPQVPKGGPVLPRAGRPQAAPQSFAAGIKPPGARGRTVPGAVPPPAVSGSARYAQQARRTGFPTAAELRARRTASESLIERLARQLVSFLLEAAVSLLPPKQWPHELREHIKDRFKDPRILPEHRLDVAKSFDAWVQSNPQVSDGSWQKQLAHGYILVGKGPLGSTILSHDQTAVGEVVERAGPVGGPNTISSKTFSKHSLLPEKASSSARSRSARTNSRDAAKRHSSSTSARQSSVVETTTLPRCHRVRHETSVNVRHKQAAALAEHLLADARDPEEML